jgi:hypothetical protein
MSGSGLFIERAHAEVGIDAVADVFAAAANSDVFSMRKHNRIVFIAHWGVGATGVNKFTVEACDNVTPSNVTLIPFWYRTLVAGAAPGAVTYQGTPATGVSNAAGSSQIILIETTAALVKAAGYDFIRLATDETTDSPVLGGIIALLLEPRFAEDETSMVA